MWHALYIKSYMAGKCISSNNKIWNDAITGMLEMVHRGHMSLENYHCRSINIFLQTFLSGTLDMSDELRFAAALATSRHRGTCIGCCTSSGGGHGKSMPDAASPLRNSAERCAQCRRAVGRNTSSVVHRTVCVPLLPHCSS